MEPRMSKPTASRVTAVRTPGAPAAEGDEPKATLADLQAENDALEAQLLAGDTQVDSDDVVAPATPAALTAPDIQALIEAGIARGVAAALATRARAESNVLRQVELPDQSEVDAFSIRKEELTKQGYVVPAAYPQPAGIPKSLL
jgi:hypothetical protein